jgi:hypothetical protein
MNLIRLSCAQCGNCLDLTMNSLACSSKDDTPSISMKSRNVLNLRGHCRLVSGALKAYMKKAKGSSISFWSSLCSSCCNKVNLDIIMKKAGLHKA